MSSSVCTESLTGEQSRKAIGSKISVTSNVFDLLTRGESMDTDARPDEIILIEANSSLSLSRFIGQFNQQLIFAQFKKVPAT